MPCPIAAQTTCSTTAAARCHPCAGTTDSAHDPSTRLLHRCHADGNDRWAEEAHGGAVTTGRLMIDTTTTDTPYRRTIAPASRHWSGTHQRVVVGITLSRPLWTDGDAHLPGDVRIDHNAHDGGTNHEHVQVMGQPAAARGWQPHLPGFDNRYATVANVTPIRSPTQPWPTRLNANRLDDPDGSGNQPIRAVPIPHYGTIVHRNGYGFINGFTMALPSGTGSFFTPS